MNDLTPQELAAMPDHAPPVDALIALEEAIASTQRPGSAATPRATTAEETL